MRLCGVTRFASQAATWNSLSNEGLSSKFSRSYTSRDCCFQEALENNNDYAQHYPNTKHWCQLGGLWTSLVLHGVFGLGSKKQPEQLSFTWPCSRIKRFLIGKKAKIKQAQLLVVDHANNLQWSCVQAPIWQLKNPLITWDEALYFFPTLFHKLVPNLLANISS